MVLDGFQFGVAQLGFYASASSGAGKEIEGGMNKFCKVSSKS
jgi:hypothetical protein